MEAFNFNAKRMYLTWSQTGQTMTIPSSQEEHIALCEEVTQKIVDFIKSVESAPDVKSCLCTVESHADGNPHVHAVVIFNKKWHIRNCRVLDDLFGVHPNIQPVRNLRDVVTYVTKTQIYYSWNFDVKSVLGKQNNKGDIIARKIISGEWTFKDCVEHEPGYALLHKHLIDDFIAYAEAAKNLEIIRPELTQGILECTWSDGQPVTIGDPVHLLNSWLRMNILQNREIRQKQLWLWGSTGTGKNRLISHLEQYLRAYWVCLDEMWSDMYNDEHFDLIVLDEYNAQRKIQWLNRFVSGQPVPLSRRRRAPIMKRKNLPVIILSNFNICGVYKNTDITDAGLVALQDRFIEIEINENFIPIEMINKINTL